MPIFLLPSNQTANLMPSPSNNNSGNPGAMQAAPAQIVIPGNMNMLPVPPAMTQVIASATGSSAVAKKVYFGNEATFNVTPTDNGSGAASITNTYGDGWSGKGYNQLIGNNDGVQVYGFTLEYVTTSTGAQNSAGLTTATPTILTADLVGGNQIPRGIVLSAGQRNSQYLAGVMTVQMNFKFNCLTQFSYFIPVGSTSTLTLLTAPF